MEINIKRFNNLYGDLNKEQKEAVDTLYGPVMVVAGPGTGKTQILTMRIANIIKEGAANPEEILALTFTESGALSMRQRLFEILGSPAYSVNICTFHGFCNSLIEEHPEFFPYVIGSVNLNEAEQWRIIENIISSTSLSELKPKGKPLHYVGEIKSSISSLKREGVKPEELMNIADKEEEAVKAYPDLVHAKGPYKGRIKGGYIKLLANIRKNKELAKVYSIYQNHLRSNNLYDYDDMITETLDALKENDDFLSILRDEFKFVLIDEYQDTNNSQNRVVELICGNEKANIFVVGDEKQAIFRFQGASLENFRYFQKLYPSVKIVNLKENYRSVQTILNAAHNVLPSHEILSSNVSYESKKILFYEFEDKESEIYFIAKRVKNNLEKGAKPEEIAILYRENKEAFDIADALSRLDIKYSIESDDDILNDPFIEKLVVLIRAVAYFGEDEFLADAMQVNCFDFHIESLDIYKLLAARKENGRRLYDILENIIGGKDDSEIKKLSLQNKEAVIEFYNLLKSWNSSDRDNNPVYTLQKILQDSRIMQNITISKDANSLKNIKSFFNYVKSWAGLGKIKKMRDLMDDVDLAKSQKIPFQKSRQAEIAGRVRLMTAHRSKGREFEYVYIVNARKGHWGDSHHRKSLVLPQAFSLTGSKLDADDKNEDERRLFYVAITRAKKEIIITYAKKNDEGRNQLPSRFAADIDSNLMEKNSEHPFKEEYEEFKNSVFLPFQKMVPSIYEKEYISYLFKKQGLSVSALNNFLKCPWTYFYKNLLRYPQVPKPHQFFGTAVHTALKNFFDALMRGNKADKELLLKSFEKSLNSKKILTSVELRDYIKKGDEILGGFYDSVKDNIIIPLETEYKVPRVDISKDVFLTGNIDKIEPAGSSNKVNVVDYKTGKFKSYNEIIGKTKNSDGNIKRQLVFYNILLNKEPEKRYKMISGEIDFIEPLKNGSYKNIKISISKDEINELEFLILEVSNKILSLAFWNERCKDPECEFCRLRNL